MNWTLEFIKEITNNKITRSSKRNKRFRLLHWLGGIDNMAAILQMTFLKSYSWMKILALWYECYWHFSMSPIDNQLVLAQIMAWHQSGDKPLFEPMMAQFADAYMHR